MPNPGEPSVHSSRATSPVFVEFIFRLREFGVPVGVTEAIALAQALKSGLHHNSLDGFYYVARALTVHHEAHLDPFDQAFAVQFRGADLAPPELKEELSDWLRDAVDRSEQDSPTELEDIDLDELKRQFAERLAQQTERHDGGNYWVGTGGTSRFGRAGAPAPGIRVGEAGGGSRSAVHVADARQYRGYRSDVTLDIRQMEVALRRLRSFIREGNEEELDIEGTIAATANNAGEIEIVTRPPSRPNTHVVLLIDVGGSMFPYSSLMSRLFSATKSATHFKELRTYYFHNCVYGKVYETDTFTEPKWLHDVLRECGPHYKLIMVGDALMAPYELHGQGGGISQEERVRVSGFDCLNLLADHFTNAVWLNPEPEGRWRGSTIEDVASVFDMFPLTLDGLSEAMRELNRGSAARA
ncbi:MAG: VWA domain-containing protein [Actinomycetia bacterium]|nr:VWA domain-containing protein [Actinomycetes bacterium]